jgi:hypothetical protein
VPGPDYIGGGTLDSGAAWWHRQLRAHPGVDSRRFHKRSLHFFEQFCVRPMTGADAEEYRRQFPARRGRLTGEWTSRYVYDAWTPALIARAAPDAKLLVIVSDPIERYRKRLARWQLKGHDYDPIRHMNDMTNRGHYVPQLRRLREYFPEERILVLQHEKCRVDPLVEYARTARFLGLDDSFAPRRLRWRAGRLRGEDKPHIRVLRRSGVPLARVKPLVRRLRGRRELDPVDLWPDIEESLHREFDGEVRELAALVPELDLSLWPNFASLATERATREPVAG